MKRSEVNRFDQLYQRHLRMLTLQGKSQKTIDAYSRSVRHIRDYFDCCPDQLAEALSIQVRDIDAGLKRIHIRRGKGHKKRMTGYKYANQEKWLIRFDNYYDRNGYTGIRITKSMVSDFIYSPTEQPSTHYLKERLLRDFALFLIRQGYHEVYVTQIKSAPTKKCSHIPYIFTGKEMRDIFFAIDAWEDSFYTNRHLIDPILFRLLYGTGLRLSEALNIMVKDFDRVNGVLTVYHAKNYKDRLLPIAPSLADRIDQFINVFHKYSKDTAYLFQSPRKNRIDNSTVYRRFRQYLQCASIPHTEAGPRVHDFRHNFAVKCLKKWVLTGEELTIDLII